MEPEVNHAACMLKKDEDSSSLLFVCKQLGINSDSVLIGTLYDSPMRATKEF